jgi:hypothetical protein
MISLLLPAAVSAVLCVAPGEARSTLADSSYRTLYESGQTFADFLGAAKQRKEMWNQNWGRAAVPDAVVARARALTGPWHLLVVAVDGCSDSVNTVPYIAKLVELVPSLQLRIVNSTAGRAVMESHRTPDGRAATPTIVLLDASYAERGCWIERPAELRRLMDDTQPKSDADKAFKDKMSWYDEDKGAKTVEDIVAMLEAAARNEVVCAKKAA